MRQRAAKRGHNSCSSSLAMASGFTKSWHPARCRRAACFGACLEFFDHASGWIGVLARFDSVVLRNIVEQKALPPKYIVKHRWTCFNLSCRIVGHDDCEPAIARRNYISGTWRSSS
jgi:hypothetical protein